jgi:hypothetical protein
MKSSLLPKGLRFRLPEHSDAKPALLRKSKQTHQTRVYTKSLRDHDANFAHEFTLNCHEVFNIIKVELQLMADQCKPPPVLFSRSSSVSIVTVCYTVPSALLEQGPLRPSRERSPVLPDPTLSYPFQSCSHPGL